MVEEMERESADFPRHGSFVDTGPVLEKLSRVKQPLAGWGKIPV